MKSSGISARFLVTARRFIACRNGVAMVEFAIVIPVLFILFAGGWEMARGLLMYEALNKSVRNASRYMARIETPTQELARRLVLTGDIDVDQPPRFNHNNLTVTFATKTFINDGTYRGPDGYNANIEVVRVQADYIFRTPLLFFLASDDPMTISVMHEQRRIRD